MADTVTRARRALDLLARGALYERRAGVRAAVMADLGAVAEAVEALARLQGELAAAGEAVAGARAEAATMARTCREEVALLRARLGAAEEALRAHDADAQAYVQSQLRQTAERRAEEDEASRARVAAAHSVDVEWR